MLLVGRFLSISGTDGSIEMMSYFKNPEDIFDIRSSLSSALVDISIVKKCNSNRSNVFIVYINNYKTIDELKQFEDRDILLNEINDIYTDMIRNNLQEDVNIYTTFGLTSKQQLLMKQLMKQLISKIENTKLNLMTEVKNSIILNNKILNNKNLDNKKIITILAQKGLNQALNMLRNRNILYGFDGFKLTKQPINAKNINKSNQLKNTIKQDIPIFFLALPKNLLNNNMIKNTEKKKNFIKSFNLLNNFNLFNLNNIRQILMQNTIQFLKSQNQKQEIQVENNVVLNNQATEIIEKDPMVENISQFNNFKDQISNNFNDCIDDFNINKKSQIIFDTPDEEMILVNEIVPSIEDKVAFCIYGPEKTRTGKNAMKLLENSLYDYYNSIEKGQKIDSYGQTINRSTDESFSQCVSRLLNDNDSGQVKLKEALSRVKKRLTSEAKSLGNIAEEHKIDQMFKKFNIKEEQQFKDVV